MVKITSKVYYPNNPIFRILFLLIMSVLFLASTIGIIYFCISMLIDFNGMNILYFVMIVFGWPTVILFTIYFFYTELGKYVEIQKMKISIPRLLYKTKPKYIFFKDIEYYTVDYGSRFKKFKVIELDEIDTIHLHLDENRQISYHKELTKGLIPELQSTLKKKRIKEKRYKY